MRTGLFRQVSRLGSYHQLTRSFSLSKAPIMAPIKVGDSIPNVDLYEGNPGNKVNTHQLFGKGKHVLVGAVGAFTPTCHDDQMSTYVNDIQTVKSKGVDSVTCIAVNDPFVMDAWGKSLKADGKIRFLADTCGEFTKAIDLPLDVTAILGNVRSQRYSMVVQDGKVTGVKVEPDSFKATCSRSTDIMDIL